MLERTPDSDRVLSLILHRFGVLLISSGSICVLCVSMDLSGMSLICQAMHPLMFCRLVIIATLTIYIIVGRDIFQTRQTLRNIAEEELYNFHPALDLRKTSKTTMIEVTSDVMTINKLQPWGESAASDAIRPESQFAPYSIHIESAEQSQHRKKSAAELNMNAVALSYLRCSFLFFIALVVTWV